MKLTIDLPEDQILRAIQSIPPEFRELAKTSRVAGVALAIEAAYKKAKAEDSNGAPEMGVQGEESRPE